MGREAETTPVEVFVGATTVDVKFLDADGNEIASGGGLPEVTTSEALPYWIGPDGTSTTTKVSVTDVATLQILLRYERKAATLETGKGDVTQEDTQTVSIRLRNKRPW
jgi:hypothetical protein